MEFCEARRRRCPLLATLLAVAWLDLTNPKPWIVQSELARCLAPDTMHCSIIPSKESSIPRSQQVCIYEREWPSTSEPCRRDCKTPRDHPLEPLVGRCWSCLYLRRRCTSRPFLSTNFRISVLSHSPVEAGLQELVLILRVVNSAFSRLLTPAGPSMRGLADGSG